MKRSDKKAVSIVVGYVILIVMAIALSGLVYNWLRFYITPSDQETCPDEIKLIIENYGYNDENGNLKVELKNKGLFTIDGFILRVNNRTNAELAVYTINLTGEQIKPNEKSQATYLAIDLQEKVAGQITLIEVQPFIREDGEKILCPKISSQRL